MKSSALKILFFCLSLLMLSCQKDEDRIVLHYLGQSAVYIDFNHEISVLCDYGEKNAYLDWGWNSPIYDAALVPDILCYSSFRPDHYDPFRVATFNSLTFSEMVDTSIGELHIRSIPSSEKDISCYDNFSFLFEYHSMKVLHLGDCQADIQAIEDSAHALKIAQRYPKNCDIVIMPLERIRRYTSKAFVFTQLLSPRILLPVNYWSNRSKNDFMQFAKQVGIDEKKIYCCKRSKGKYIYKGLKENRLVILNLYPAKQKSR